MAIDTQWRAMEDQRQDRIARADQWGEAERIAARWSPKRPPGAHPKAKEIVTASAAAVMDYGHSPTDDHVEEEVRFRMDLRTQRAFDAWRDAVDQLTSAPATIDLWIKPLELVGELRNELAVTGHPALVRWVGRRYREVLSMRISNSSSLDGVRFYPRTYLYSYEDSHEY